MIVCNVYAPNNYNATNFEKMKHTFIVMGDFNITLENRDSADSHEINTKRMTQDILLDTNTKDCEIEITPTEGFTWHRGDIMSRLDMLFVSSGKATMCTKHLLAGMW
jgi:exonuclease III